MADDESRKMKILIAEHSDSERKLFCDMLGDEYEIFEASTSEETINEIDKYIAEISLVLLGMDSTETGGLEVLKMMNSMGWIDTTPVIVVSFDDSSNLMQKAYDLGATDYISRSTSVSVIKKRIENTIRLFAKQRSVLLALEERNRMLSERNRHLAYTDELTGCLNLEGFKQRVKEILKMYPDKQYAVWYMDIKHFKFVNDFFGYEEGNKLLKSWSRVLDELLDSDEVHGRMSGDCFVAFTRVSDNRDVKSLFDAISEKMLDYFTGKEFKVNVYAGVYILKPQDATTINIDQMIAQARVAQSTVKDLNGGAAATFDDEQWTRQWRNMAIDNHLDDALRNGEVKVYLQPQYNYITGDLVGAEALCRWNHAELGWISPGEFIPVLEKTGQIFKLDKFVWERCCQLIRKWSDDAKFPNLSLSVNISRADLNSGDVEACITALLKKYNLEPQRLHLEITESAYMDEPYKLIEKVASFKKCGFKVEMDDFGSGFSSLNILKDVPVDVLKIDFKFLHGQDAKTRSGIILSSILKMAHQMDMPVICEGVETQLQADFMKNIGCRLMQGFYFARPMDEESFEKVLATKKTGTIMNHVSTEGRKKLNSLFDSESSSSFIFNQCIGGAILFEYYEGKCDVLLANEAFYKVEGLDRSIHLHNVNILDFIGDNREGFVAALEEALETGDATCEYGINVSGARVLAHFRPVALADHGNIFFVSVEDVTDSYNAKKMLHETNDELQAILSLMPCGVFRYEAGGEQRFDYVSDGMLKLLEYDNIDDFKKACHNCFPGIIYPEDRARVLGEINEQIADHPYDFCEYRVMTATGEIKRLFDKGKIVYNDDGKKYFYVVVVDITDPYANKMPYKSE